MSTEPVEVPVEMSFTYSDNLNHSRTVNDMKIGSLNVCGLKYRCNYQEFVDLISEYDIFCIQESKVDEYDIINVPQFKFFSKPCSEKYLRKSGGIGFFVRNTFLDFVEIIETNCDYIFWLKLITTNLVNTNIVCYLVM